MVEKITRQSRLLFILTDDFGEQGTMKYFTTSQVFEKQVVILCSEKRLDAVKAANHQQVRTYRDVDSILSAVDELRPHAIFFCSAYLLNRNAILDLTEVETLVRELQQRESVLVTTDPLLGFIETMKVWQVNPLALSSRSQSLLRKLCLLPRQWFLFREFKYLSELLRPFVHLYPVPESAVKPATGRTRVFFHNTALSEPITVSESDHERGRAWIFVISEIDLGIQRSLHGATIFACLLSERIEELCSSGRDVVVMGPPSLKRQLSIAGKIGNRFRYLSEPPFELFNSTLLSAELAIYWNLFSNSAFDRLMKGQAVAFADKGHMARVFKGSEKVARRACFGGAETPTLDLRGEFTVETQIQLLARAEHSASAIATHLSVSPSPESALEKILSRSPDRF